MAETPPGHVERPQPLDASFLSKIHNLEQVLKTERPEVARDRFFGPIYRVMNQGRLVECRPVRLSYDQPTGNTVWNIVAVDQTGRAVADSRVTLKRQADQQLVAGNEVMTGIRGVGFALPPLLVFFDIMKREAARLDEPIIAQERDGHLEEMRYLQAVLDNDRHNPDGTHHIEERLRQLRTERPRWVALFGPGGQLGYDRDFKKKIKPQAQIRPWTQLEEVILEARLEQGTPVVVDEVPLSTDVSAAVQAGRQADLLEILKQTAKTPKTW